MSFDFFEHVVTGADLDGAFVELRDEARETYGFRPGQTGTVADLFDVALVHDAGPVPLERAMELAKTEYGYGDAYTAHAIELCVSPGEPHQWLIFGTAHY